LLRGRAAIAFDIFASRKGASRAGSKRAETPETTRENQEPL
jgi:hypothetical protein